MKRNRSSQCIETEKMLKILENDSALERSGKKGQNFAYTLQNIEPLRNAVINEMMPTKLNKLKKSNIVLLY